MGGDLADQWMCVLTRMSDEVNLYDKCKEACQFENPDDWSHYDHVGTCLVAARTKFELQEPACDVVMVEMVFDADVLTQEQDLDFAAVHFSDWTGNRSQTNGRSYIGLGNEAVLASHYSQKSSLLRNATESSDIV